MSPNFLTHFLKRLAQRILEGGADGILIITISRTTNLLHSLFFGEKSSTPQPLPKKTSKCLFYLYLWYFKQWRHRREGGILLQVRNRTSYSASLQHKPSLLFKHPRNGLSRPRDRRLAITNSHSKSMTPDHSQTFSPPCRQHYRRRVKPGGWCSGPTGLCCLHCPTPQDGWKVRLRHSDIS